MLFFKYRHSYINTCVFIIDDKSRIIERVFIRIFHFYDLLRDES